MIRRAGSPKREQFLYPGDELRPSQRHKLRLQGATKQAVETGRLRLAVTGGLFGLAFACIAVRLTDLMVLNHTADMRTVQPTGTAPSAAARADIVDRNGVIVATNLPTVNAYADCTKIDDPKAAADALLRVLPDLDYDETLERLSADHRFIYIRRHLTPSQQMAVNRLGIPGIYFEESERRVYPQGSLFAHVLGTTDPDNRGTAGIEKEFDQALFENPGKPLHLSLDARAQFAALETLAEGISRFRADAGAAVVMDIRTGEVIAMVSLPDFDPQTMGDASADARFNRATLGLYEMGSTFKLFTAAMALENGTSTLASKYDAIQPLQMGRFTISDYHGENRWLSVPEIMIHSSNIGAAKMALEMGTRVQRDYFDRFGLLAPMSLELPELGTPHYPSPWREINTVTIAYGYGISVTPVHVANAVSALVNGGTLIQPTLVKRRSDALPKGTRVISQAVSDQMRALMRLVVMYGSGRQADVVGYHIGGKTGSAEKTAYRGGYSRHRLRTSFVAAFPMYAPRYVVVVVMDEPRGTKETYNFATAGWNAAPTAGTIIAKIAPTLGIFPEDKRETFEPLATLVASGAFGGENDYVRATKTVAAVPAMMMGEIQAPLPEPIHVAAKHVLSPHASDAIAALIEAGMPAAGDAGETQ